MTSALALVMHLDDLLFNRGQAPDPGAENHAQLFRLHCFRSQASHLVGFLAGLDGVLGIQIHPLAVFLADNLTDVKSSISPATADAGLTGIKLLDRLDADHAI